MSGQFCSGESEGLTPQCKSVLCPFVKDSRISVWEVGGWSGQGLVPEPRTLPLPFHNSPPSDFSSRDLKALNKP